MNSPPYCTHLKTLKSTHSPRAKESGAATLRAPSHVRHSSKSFLNHSVTPIFLNSSSFGKMIWAADFDESLACNLDENCPEVLLIPLPKEIEADSGEESVDGNGGGPPKHKSLEHSISDSTAMAAAARPFCGLTKSFWSRNDRMQIHTVITSRNGDDELPVFCVAAILIMNRHKITKESRSIDDLIKIFNDNLLKFRVKSCIRSAIKLRKKYIYKMIKSRTPAQNGN